MTEILLSIPQDSEAFGTAPRRDGFTVVGCPWGPPLSLDDCRGRPALRQLTLRRLEMSSGVERVTGHDARQLVVEEHLRQQLLA